jgi:hypothetical protein
MTGQEDFCIYIQKIRIDMKDHEITDTIENIICIGTVSRIEHVNKSGKYLSVLVYFKCVIWSPKTMEVLTSISNGHSYKLYVDYKIFWIARQKCMNYNVIELLANRIYKMEEMMEVQNAKITELLAIVKKDQNEDSVSGDTFFYVSDSSSSSSVESLFNGTTF